MKLPVSMAAIAAQTQLGPVIQNISQLPKQQRETRFGANNRAALYMKNDNLGAEASGIKNNQGSVPTSMAAKNSVSHSATAEQRLHNIYGIEQKLLPL